MPRFASSLLALALGFLILGSSGASAAVYVAPTGVDGGTCTSSSSPCRTISYAVGQAADPDTVNLAAGTYAGAGNRNIGFSKELTFQGAGKAATIIDGENSGYLLWSQADPLILRNLSLKDASNPSPTVTNRGSAVIAYFVNEFFDEFYFDITAHDVSVTGASTDDYGAAMVGKSITVTGASSFTDNQASDGGAIYATENAFIDPGAGATATFANNLSEGDGGAIYAGDFATIDNSVFTGSPDPTGFTSGEDGGAVYVHRDSDPTFDLVVTDSSFSSFRIEGSEGGALSTRRGGVSLDGVTIQNSSSASYGGGLYSDDEAEVRNSTFIGNQTGLQGGGAFLYDSAVVENSTFRNNDAGDGSSSLGDGGGLFVEYSATVSDSTFQGNSANNGAGAYFKREPSTVTDSTFDDNTAVSRGGGLSLKEGTISASTFTANEGTFAAIEARGDGALSLTNSTVTGNSGTGIVASSDGFETAPITLLNVTVAGNTLSPSSDVAVLDVSEYADSGTLDVTNSIIAEGSDGCSAGSFASGGGNVVQDSTSGCDALVGGPPAPATKVSSSQIGLQVLELNPPGTTETMALADGSVAISSAVAAECPATDQRGASRPSASCSSGAFQWFESFDLTVTKAGSGTGTVTSEPAGIECGSICADSYESGTEVVLTASPDPGSSFVGWSGSCSGASTCEVTMTEARGVTATFAVAGAPKLAVESKVSPRKIRAGKRFRVRVTVSNIGVGAASRVKTCLRVPKGTAIVSKGQGELKGGRICWNRATLESEASTVYLVTFRSLKSAKGKLRTASKASASNARSVSDPGRGLGTVRVLPVPRPKPQPPTG